MIEGKEYLLRVVYEDKEEQNTVLTAYLTSQVNRYWKEWKDEIEYDPTHDLLNIEFVSDVSIDESVELDGIIIDYSKDKRIVGIEILDAGKRTTRIRLTYSISQSLEKIGSITRNIIPLTDN